MYGVSAYDCCGEFFGDEGSLLYCVRKAAELKRKYDGAVVEVYRPDGIDLGCPSGMSDNDTERVYEMVERMIRRAA